MPQASVEPDRLSIDLNAIHTPYVYRPFPRVIYRNGQTCVVQTGAELTAKQAEGWGLTPGALSVPVPVVEAAPEPAPEPEPAQPADLEPPRGPDEPPMPPPAPIPPKRSRSRPRKR